MITARVVFLGGPHDRERATISALPERVSIGGVCYERVDDPDTGAPLGAYVWEGAPQHLAPVTTNR